MSGQHEHLQSSLRDDVELMLLARQGDEERTATDAELADQQLAEQRGQFARKLDYVLSLVGYSVGLANIWRFPYLWCAAPRPARRCPAHPRLVQLPERRRWAARAGGRLAAARDLACLQAPSSCPTWSAWCCAGCRSSSSRWPWASSPAARRPPCGPCAPGWKARRAQGAAALDCGSRSGVGWASVAVSLLCSWYFNVLLGYAVFFMWQSFTLDQLPWAACGQWWNSPRCLDYNNATVAHQFRAFLDWRRAGANHSLRLDFFAHYENVSWRSPSEEFFKWVRVERTTLRTAHEPVFQRSSAANLRGAARAGRRGVGVGAVPALQLDPHLFVPGERRGVVREGDPWRRTVLCDRVPARLPFQAVYFTATFPYIILTILLVRGLTLEGAMEGILFYISPNFAYVFKPKAWADAAFQVFFSLGPGWGGLITMGSYNNFHNNVYRLRCLCEICSNQNLQPFRDSMYLPLAMELTSVYAGFVVFSVLGFMARRVGRPITEVVAEGPDKVTLGPAMWCICSLFQVLAYFLWHTLRLSASYHFPNSGLSCSFSWFLLLGSIPKYLSAIHYIRNAI